MRTSLGTRLDAIEKAHRARLSGAAYRTKEERDATIGSPPTDPIEMATAMRRAIEAYPTVAPADVTARAVTLAWLRADT